MARFAVCLATVGLLFATAIPTTPHTNVRAFADRKAEGAELFTTSGCIHCHGAAIQGTAKGPALLNVRKKLTADQMHKQIAEGGTSMPAFGDSLTKDQIDELVEFLRNKHPEKLFATLPKQPPQPKP